jgi:hypothetical protein
MIFSSKASVMFFITASSTHNMWRGEVCQVFVTAKVTLIFNVSGTSAVQYSLFEQRLTAPKAAEHRVQLPRRIKTAQYGIARLHLLFRTTP